MGYSDDIAEKIFDLFTDQAPRAASFVLDTGSNVSKGIGSLTRSFLAEILKSLKDEKELKALLDLSGEVDAAKMNEAVKRLGQNSNTVCVADSDAKDFEKLLKQQDILFAKMNMMSDNKKVFVYLSKDSSKVQEATNVLFAMRGKVCEVPPNMYFKNLVPENVRTVDGLDPVETELFRHYAREQKLLYTIIPREDGKSLLVYDQKDVYKARRALLNTGWDLTGANGALYRKQVEYRIEGRNKIRYAVEEAERELFIVSRDRPDTYVHVTAADYTLYKAGKAVSNVARTTPDFDVRCMAACEGLNRPVVLESGEFMPGMKAEALQEKPTLDLHVHNYDEEIEMDRLSSYIDLVAKSSLDDEHNAPWGIEDPSISYSEFSGMEFIMDTEEREAREYEFERFKKAAWYVKDKYTTDEVKVDQKSIDFIIAKAEAKRRAGNEPVREGHTQQRASQKTTEKAL